MVQTLFNMGVTPLTPDMNNLNNRSDKVFLNGQWIGNHAHPAEFVQDIRRMRRENDLPKEYAIVRDIDKREIKINTDAGRVQRAMFIVKDNKLLVRKKHIQKILTKEWDFEQLFRHGLVELLDVEEEENAMIAMFMSNLRQDSIQGQS